MKFGFSCLIGFSSAFWDCNKSSYINSQVVKASTQGLLLFLHIDKREHFGDESRVQRKRLLFSYGKSSVHTALSRTVRKDRCNRGDRGENLCRMKRKCELGASELGGPLGTTPPNHLVFYTRKQSRGGSAPCLSSQG